VEGRAAGDEDDAPPALDGRQVIGQPAELDQPLRPRVTISTLRAGREPSFNEETPGKVKMLRRQCAIASQLSSSGTGRNFGEAGHQQHTLWEPIRLTRPLIVCSRLSGCSWISFCGSQDSSQVDEKSARIRHHREVRIGYELDACVGLALRYSYCQQNSTVTRVTRLNKPA